MNNAELVPVRVTHISQIAAGATAFAPAGGVFDWGAAVGKGCGYRLVNLLGRRCRQSQRKTVVLRGGLTISRRGNQQAKAVMAPRKTVKTIDMNVRAGRGAECAQYSVVEAAAGFGVVGA